MFEISTSILLRHWNCWEVYFSLVPGVSFWFKHYDI